MIIKYNNNNKKPTKKSKNWLSPKLWLNQEKIIKNVRIYLNFIIKRLDQLF